MKKSKKERDPGQRAIDIPVVTKDKAQYLRALKAIRTFRLLFSKLSEIVKMFEIAGANFGATADGDLKVKLDYEKVTLLAKALFGDKVKDSLRYYEVRPHFFELLAAAREQDPAVPNFRSFIWDSCRQTLQAQRCKDDPRIKIPRHLLVANAERPDVRADNIGLPVLYCDSAKHAHFSENQGFSIELEYEHDAEPLTLIAEGTFEKDGKIYQKKLSDGGSHVLHKIVSGEWSAQTVILNEYQGSLSLHIPYRRPAQVQRVSDFDPERTAELTFSDRLCEEGTDAGKRFFLHLRVPKVSAVRDSDKYRTYSIPVNDILCLLTKQNQQREALNLQIDSCPWSLQTRKDALCGRRDNLTRYGEEIRKNQNHAWSKRLVAIASSWGCGKIKVFNLPKNSAPEEASEKCEYGLLGFKWPWCQFRDKLVYKAEFAGLKVEVVDTPSVSDIAGKVKEVKVKKETKEVA